MINTLNHEVLNWDNNDNIIANGNNDEDGADLKDVDALSVVGGNAGSVGGKQNYPPYNSVIISETQIIGDITFDNFDLLRNGFIYVGPPDFTKALSFPETALHHDVQAARPQIDIKSEDSREKSPVSLNINGFLIRNLICWTSVFFLSIEKIATKSAKCIESFQCTGCASMGTSSVYRGFVNVTK